jgi:catechol 2,3-dioxygenase-like lactoylglutathione lyase family enzyme
MTVPRGGRVQLALNVEDLDASIAFYARLFDTRPAKVRPGYANFAIDEPPLKLVLIEAGEGGSINHLGVEVADRSSVDDAMERFGVAGMPTLVEEEVGCCYALQDKVWVTAPDGERWEYYTVLGDLPAEDDGDGVASACCADDSRPVTV